MAQLAKLSRPRLQSVFPRHRLFRRLDEARAQPAVWLAGPPGSGKTSLVAGYLEARGLNGLWYELDEGDGDLATFFGYLATAAGYCGADKAPLPSFTPEYLGNAGAFARRWFRALSGELPTPCVLVFDNYQEVPANSVFHTVMQAALAEIPEGVNAILISRRAPPPELSRLRVNGRMTVVTSHELRLSRKEVHGIATLRAGLKLSRSALDDLHQRSQGWAAGLVLLLAHGARTAEGLAPGRHSATPGLFDYFASEVFGRASPEVRQVLLETSPLPAVTAAMATRITGLSRAGKILDELSQHGYFTTRHDGAESSFQYHPLFHDFLRARAKQELPAERWREICRQSVRLLVEEGQPEAAVELALAEGEFREVARLALEQAPAMMAAGRAATLRSWIGRLPAEMLEQNFWLEYWFGLSTHPFEPLEGQRRLEHCFEQLRGSQDPAALYTVWSTVVGGYAYLWDTVEPLDRWIDEWEALRRRFPQFPSLEVEELSTAAIFTALCLRRPDHPEMGHWHARCLEMLRRAGRLQQRISASWILMVHVLWSGRHSEMEEFLATLESGLSGARDPMARMTLFFARGLFHWFHQASFPTGLKEVEAALGEMSGAPVWECFIRAHAACLATDLAVAEEHLRQARRNLHSSHRMVSAFYWLAEAQVAHRRGEWRRAVEMGTRSLELARGTGAYFSEMFALAVLGVAHIALGEAELALERLQAMRRIGRAAGNLYTEYMGLMSLALLALRQKRLEDAVPLLREATDLGAANGIFVHPDLRPDELADLCGFALERGIGAEYACELIRRHQLSPTGAMVLDARWPRPIQVRMLDGFELRPAGQPAQSLARSRRKPLELLKALVAFGTETVPVGKLIDALWPEAEGDAAHHALETNVYRLRQLLGSEAAVVQRRGHLGIDPRVCWIDAWALNRRLGQALSVLEHGGRVDDPVAEAASLAELYAGPLLPGDQETLWIQAARQRLRTRFGRCLKLLGRCGGSPECAGELERLRHLCLERDPALAQSWSEPG